MFPDAVTIDQHGQPLALSQEWASTKLAFGGLASTVLSFVLHTTATALRKLIQSRRGEEGLKDEGKLSFNSVF